MSIVNKEFMSMEFQSRAEGGTDKFEVDPQHQGTLSVNEGGVLTLNQDLVSVEKLLEEVINENIVKQCINNIKESQERLKETMDEA
ncbi:hypothetical protein EJ063_07515 [Vibrio aquaticus]|uniref:Uncharacterized protein n=1 Tax=Vibrio aquaticus TaxID=2496559 RepID=A0A3S0QEA7_9VIBR|nr:hypothetical protein [Vibrio aquaticus]RTZ16634.1 hypothetical protein EJ063_07515 [Vibrio aquaticus]